MRLCALKDNKRGRQLRKPAYKLAFITTICMSAIFITACQTPTTMVKKDPEKAVKVRTQLAAEYIKSGDLDSAKRTLDQALEMNPRDSAANMMMGILLQQEGSKVSKESS